MVSIDEMRKYRDREEQKERDKEFALRREILDMELKINCEMLPDILDLLEYGKNALEYGCIPKYSSQDDLHIKDCEHIYTDGWSHWVGYWTEMDCIVGIGIMNGGANGEYYLIVDGGGVHWVLGRDRTRGMGCARMTDKEYKYNLKKFIDGYDAFKQRVYTLVESRVREV